MSKNQTLEWLQAHRGQLLVVSDRIYLYKENIWLESNFPVLLLNAVTTTEATACGGAARGTAVLAPDAANEVAAAELLYPDGVVRWTYVIVNTQGYKNSLSEMQKK